MMRTSDHDVTETIRAACSDDRQRGDPEITQRLQLRQRQLADQAATHGLLDVVYRTLETPIGDVLLAATRAGLARVAFAVQDHDRVLAELSQHVGPRILRAPRQLDDVAHQIDQYFAGHRRRFQVPLDLQLVHGFRREVVERINEIPYGRTSTYAAVAVAAGSPRAVRAVGSACAANPVPIVVPCHRVLRSNGALGGYAGGVDTKRALLALEQAQAGPVDAPRR